MTFSISDQELQSFQKIANLTGRSEHELIHEAVAEFISKFDLEHRRELLAQAAGMWRDRSDSEFTELRKEFDRGEHS